MKVKQVLIILFCLIGGCCEAQSPAQSPTSIPTIIPPSPNAASFQKYGDIQVSAYTGLPNIAVPIYTIKEGDLTLPISLTYHASGIKVAEESSRVGLGWVLNAGGVISRNVVGIEDFISGPNSYMNNASHTQPDLVNGPGGNQGSLQIQKGCNVVIPNFPDISNTLTNASSYDFQPDQYYYSCGTHSGKFFLKSSGAAVVAKQEKIQIQLLDQSGSGFQITTDDGVKYLFTQFETCTDFSTPGSPSAVKTAWYLTSITSPEGNQITLQYSTLSSYVNTIGGFSETQNPTTVTRTPSSLCTIQFTTPGTGTVRGPIPGKLYSNVYLDKIIFREGEVDMTYADDRQDVQNDRRISAVKVYSYDPLGNPVLYKTWQMYQSYFTGSADQDYTLAVSSNYITKRLKLDSVSEMDNAGNKIPPYIFHYNNESSVASTVPAKTSFARDHWGYYNNRPGNASLVPVFASSQSTDPVVAAIGSMGDNRDPDPSSVLLFALNQIIYPTGGDTKFDFESNDFDIAKSSVNDNSYNAAIPENVSQTVFKTYAGNIASQPTSNPSDIASKTLDLTNLYVAPQASQSVIALGAFFRFNTNVTACYPAQLNNTIHFQLINATTNAQVSSGELSSFIGQPSEPTASCVGGSPLQGIQFSNHYTVSPGQYLWKIQIDPSVTVIGDVGLSVNYTAVAAATNPYAIGGGLRVKRITETDQFGLNPKRIKRYSYGYSDPNSNYRSYGRRMSRPIYSYVQRDYRTDMCGTGGAYVSSDVQRVTYGADSNVPLSGSANGGVVGYDTVSEYIGENGEFGKTQYIYKNNPDLILDYTVSDYWGNASNQYYSVPRRPPISSTIPFPDNGELIKQSNYSNINGTFFKIKDVVNTYNYQTNQGSWQWYGIDVRKIPNAGATNSSACDIDVFVYPAITSCWYTPASVVETEYSLKNIGISFAKSTFFFYDNPAHMQLTRKVESQSNGETRTVQTLYPADYPDAQLDAAALSMKNVRFMHASMISQLQYTTKTDGSQVVTGGLAKKYQVLGSNLLSAEVATVNISSAQSLASFPAYNPSSGAFPAGYESKLVYDSYDLYGNPIQIHNTNNINHNFIWDYHFSHPIAEVINGSSTSIAYTSFEADGSGNWTIPTTARTVSAFTGNKSYALTSGSITKSSLPSGTQYIVSYWALGGPANVNSVSATTGPNRRGWTYYEHVLPSTTTSVSVSGSVTIDELRLYPLGAKMTSYTHLPLVGATTNADVNSRVNYNEFDSFGRLHLVRDQDGNVVKTVDYHYQNQVGF